MINIIAIADDDSLVGNIEPNAEVDILISLGDLYDVTLQKAVDLYAPEQVFAQTALELRIIQTNWID